MSRALALPLLATALAGCSALVDPDTSLLDPDGGRLDGGVDSGPRPDAPPPDDAPACTTPCDDGIACTSDGCAAGECVRVPDDSACGDGERCQVGVGCVARMCSADSECNDRLFCNGDERCAPMAPGSDPETGCVAGTAPECGDDFSCTTDACDEDADACVSTPDAAACDDGLPCTVDTCDGSGAGSGCRSVPDDSLCASSACMVGASCDPLAGCVGGATPDCRDGNPCTEDSCSEEMGGCVHPIRDADGDGHPARAVPGRLCGGTDCDDGNPDVNPAAMETCNGRDDDCNGTTDDGCVPLPEDCGTAQAIALAADGTGSASGTLGDHRSDYGTGCGRTGGPDAVYYVDLTAPSDITLDTLGSDADTVLGVAISCSGDGFRLGCDDDIDSGIVTASRIWLHRITPPAGGLRLYILVDGFDAAATGSYVLNVRVSTPPGGRRCGGDLLDITGGGTLIGVMPTPVVALGDTAGTCQGVAELELEDIVSFRGPEDGTASFQAIARDFVPDIYVRADPCATGAELECDVGASAGGGINVARIDADTARGAPHYLFIDGASGGDAYNVSFEP